MTTRSPSFHRKHWHRYGRGRSSSGGIRHKEIVGPFIAAEWISSPYRWTTSSHYEEIFTRFEETATDDSIIVFASGDPVILRFANTIKRKLPEADILLYPAHFLADARHGTASSCRMTTCAPSPRMDARGRSSTAPSQSMYPKEGIPHRAANIPRSPLPPACWNTGTPHYTLYIGEHLGNPEKGTHTPDDTGSGFR